MKKSLAAAFFAFCVTFLLLGPIDPKTDAEHAQVAKTVR